LKQHEVEKTLLRALFKPEYLAIFVSFGALAVSLYSPLKDAFAKPDLRLSVPSYFSLSTNLGVPQVVSQVRIVNNGSAPGKYYELKCNILSNVENIELSATAIVLPTGYGQVTTMPFSGDTLEGIEKLNGTQKKFLNDILCVPAKSIRSSSSEYKRIIAAVRQEVQKFGGVDCNRNWFERYFRLSDETTSSINEFFDANFSLSPGDYSIDFVLYDDENQVIDRFKKTFQLSSQDVELLREPLELAAYGFGTVCPLPGSGSVEVSYEASSS